MSVGDDVQLAVKEPLLFTFFTAFSTLSFFASLLAPFAVRFGRLRGVDIADGAFFSLLVWITIGDDYRRVNRELIVEVRKQ